MTTPKDSADFKRATVAEVLAGEKRISQMCRARGIDQKTLRRWRQDDEQKGPDAWTTPATGSGSAEETIAQLERGAPSGPGQLTVENIARKKLGRQNVLEGGGDLAAEEGSLSQKWRTLPVWGAIQYTGGKTVGEGREMPLRAISREQGWLLPPSVDELVGEDHPARFVAAFVEALDEAALGELGIDAGEEVGAPAYPPRLLLSIWIYGFLRGIRSSRKREVACREQLPFLWLSGCSHPDHNTLWRFYQAHRDQMHHLLKRTVRAMVKLGLIDLALQAVDGTKVLGNAAKDRTYDADELAKLLERTESAIRDLEAQNTTGGDSPPPALPPSLRKKQNLRKQIETALAQLRAEEDATRINLTDPEAVLLRGRSGYVTGYNAQAMVSPLCPTEAGHSGLVISAAAITTDPDDHRQLVPMIAQARENLGAAVGVTLADAGYHSGENLEACAHAGIAIVMPESQTAKQLAGPYHKDAFVYNPDANTYTCPEGHVLTWRDEKQRTGRSSAQIYRPLGGTCRACPAFGVCTKSRLGRSLEIDAREKILRAHRTRMAQPANQELFRQRKELPEPTFGILKEQMGGRRFLLRGKANVRAEWNLLATAFNLRTLSRIWQRRTPPERAGLVAALAS